MTKTGQRRGATGSVTADGHGTGIRNRVIVNDHGGTGGGQKSASSLHKTASVHPESASEPDGPGSGPKTWTDESARIHKTVNESTTHETGHATHQTRSGLDVAPPGAPGHVTERPGKSESGSGPRKSLQPRESAIVDRAPPRQRKQPEEGQSERAQLTPESERHTLPQKPRRPPPPPPKGQEGGGETT